MTRSKQKYIRKGKFYVINDIERIAYEKANNEYALAKSASDGYGVPIIDDCIIGTVSLHIMEFVVPDVMRYTMSYECAYEESLDIRVAYARAALDKVKIGKFG